MIFKPHGQTVAYMRLIGVMSNLKIIEYYLSIPTSDPTMAYHDYSSTTRDTNKEYINMYETNHPN